MNGRLSLRDLLTQAFYNRRIILACLLFGLLAGLAGAILSPRRYTAESLLLLHPDEEASGQQNIGGSAAVPLPDLAARMIESDVRIVTSDPVLRAAVEHLGDTPPAKIDRAVERLRKQLDVKAQTDSNIIRIAFADPDRARAIRAVDAIVQSYGEKRTGAYLTNVGGSGQKELGTYADDLRSIETQIRDTQAAAGVLDITQDIQIAATRLDDATQRADEAHQRLAAVRAALGEAGSELGQMPAQVLDSEESSNAKANDEARNTLAKLQLQRQHTVEQYTPAWPGLRDLDQRIAAAQAQVATSDRALSRNEKRVRNPLVGQVQGKLSDLRIEEASTVQQIAKLDEEVRAARDRVATVRNAEHDLRDLQRTHDVMESIYKQLTITNASARLHDRELDQRNGSVRVLQAATAPPHPSSHAILIFAAGLLLGLAAAVVASALATLLRQEFITPEEASRTLRLPLLAIVPEAASELEGAAAEDAILPLAHHVANTLVDGSPLRTLRIVGADANSPDPARFALCLAVLLASASGKGVLLVDTSRHGELTGPAADTGSRSIALNDHRLDLIESAVPDIWALTPAARDVLARARPAELMAFMELAGRSFDQVLVIGDDGWGQRLTRGAYHIVDANLILVHEGQTRAPAVRQLREAILAASGNLIGFAYLGRRLYIPEKVYRWL